MAVGYDGTIKINSSIDATGFNRGLAAMTGSLRGLAAAVGLAFGTAAIVLFGKSAVAAATEMTNALTGLRSVLEGTGKSFEAGERFIREYIADGLVPATNAINAYKNLALRGYDTTQIEQTLIALKDSAAFGRQASLTLGQAVQSASEGLKNENSILVDNAGVTKNVAKMWEDYARSIGTTVNALTKQQKIQAEVAGIMEETRFQTGDAAKLAAGYSGQVSALATSFYNLKVAVGNTFIPILTKIIPYIKAVIDWLVVLFNTFARVIAIFFNVESSVASTEAAAGGIAENTGDAAGAAGELADNTKKAEKAAKGALAAFDEINVLQQDTAGGSGAGGGAGVPSLPTPEIGEARDLIPDELIARVEAFKQALLELFTPATEAFERLKGALAGLGKTAWEALRWAWDNILVPLGEWVITQALPAFLDLLAGALTVLNAVLIALKPLGIWLFEQFLKPAAAWVGQAIIDALGWLTERLYDLSDWILENQGAVQTIAIVLGAFAAAWLIVTGAVAAWTAISGLAAAATTAFGAAVAFLTSPVGIAIVIIGVLIAAIVLLVRHWDTVKAKAEQVWAAIVAVWAPVGAWFAENVTGPLGEKFGELAETLRESGQRIYETFIKPLAALFMEYLWPIIQQVIDFIKVYVAALVDVLQVALNVLVSTFKAAFTTSVEVFKDLLVMIVDVVGGIITSLGGVIKFLTGIFTRDWGLALEGIRDIFRGTFESLVGIVRGVVNIIIDLVNGMIRAIAGGLNAIIGMLNRLRFTVPDWVPGFGGSVWGMNIPTVGVVQIPRLATGAVIPANSEFLAILGDQRSGRNIETPEGLLRQIVREELGRVEADVRIEFGGTLGALVRELKPMIDKEHVRVGRSLVTGGAA